jgi:hypothetical protein
MPEVDPDIEELAKTAYEAWRKSVGYTISWESVNYLHPEGQQAMRLVARAVRDKVIEQMRRNGDPVFSFNGIPFVYNVGFPNSKTPCSKEQS